MKAYLAGRIILKRNMDEKKKLMLLCYSVECGELVMECDSAGSFLFFTDASSPLV